LIRLSELFTDYSAAYTGNLMLQLCPGLPAIESVLVVGYWEKFSQAQIYVSRALALPSEERNAAVKPKRHSETGSARY
jgi:hypothetical protein